MQEWAQECTLNDIYNEVCLDSPIYIPSQDVISFHSEQLQSNKIKIILDDRTNDNGNRLPETYIQSKRNWSKVMYP